MVATSSERGTRSMRMSLMSDRMTRVVNSTSSANTKVQIGSASWKRGSSCNIACFSVWLLAGGAVPAKSAGHACREPRAVICELTVAASGQMFENFGVSQWFNERVQSGDAVAWQRTAVGWTGRPTCDSACLFPPDERAGERDADALHEVPEDVDHRAPQVNVAAVLTRVAVPVTVAVTCKLPFWVVRVGIHAAFEFALCAGSTM